MTDFYKMSAMMKDLFPSNPQADKEALMNMAGKTPESAEPTKNYIQESADVAEGSLAIDKDYSISDFAKLAGIQLNETQKEGPAGQLKGKDAIGKQPAMTTKNPTRDKLVGEHNIDTLRKDTEIGDIDKALKKLGADMGLKGPYLNAWQKFAFDAFMKISFRQTKDKGYDSFKAERSLSKGEEKEKERIVKGMKKAKGDFKDRYGDDAEAVMYATATKNAKKNAESSIKEQLLKALNDLK